MRVGLTAAMFMLAACAAFAQQGGYSGPGGTGGMGNQGSYGRQENAPSNGQNTPLDNSTFNSRRSDSDARKLTPKAPSKEDILHDAAALAKAAPLACEVTDAALLNDGMANINGQNIHVRSFEMACSNGMGYFMVEQPPEKTIGFSCFGADATRAKDIAAGREPQPACALPANADRKAMAGAVLSKLGIPCQVNNVHWIGQEAKTNSEYTEAACTGGTGYVIKSSMPGSETPPSAVTCPESYRHGVPCTMSSNGAPLVTLNTFKDAIAAHHVSCTVEGVRSMGVETKTQRHVVEFKCPEQPKGLVALIPLEGNPAPFETMDCAKAASRFHQLCVLTR